VVLEGLLGGGSSLSRFLIDFQLLPFYPFSPLIPICTATDPLEVLDWRCLPDRSTLSCHYKALYPVIQELIAFLGQSNGALGQELNPKHLHEDQSLFKAQDTVWDQSDRWQDAFLRNYGI
jgi:hypothetical protein